MTAHKKNNKYKKKNKHTIKRTKQTKLSSTWIEMICPQTKQNEEQGQSNGIKSSLRTASKDERILLWFNINYQKTSYSVPHFWTQRSLPLFR